MSSADLIVLVLVLVAMAFRSIFGKTDSASHLAPSTSEQNNDGKLSLASESKKPNITRKNKHPTTVDGSTNSTSSTDLQRRAQHDLITVQALQAGRNKQGTTPKSTTRNLKKPLSTEEVNLALEGLDAAEAAGKRGDLESALRMYQVSLEVLVSAISQPPPPSSSFNESGLPFDTSVLKGRVALAMTDAENIKAQLSRRNRQIISNYPSNSTRRIQRTKSNTSRPGATPNNRNVAGVNVPTPAISSSRSTETAESSDKDAYTKLVESDMLVDTSTIGVKWDDVAGLERAKEALQEAVILPLLRPDLYTGLRAPPRGILLYGPPGTGKTLIVKAAASESQCTLLSCSSSTVTSKWHGEGEKILRALFRLAAELSPSMIFIDEIDALLSKRKEDEHEASRRFKTEFMIQMEGIRNNDSLSSSSSHVLVLGCTNCPWDIDDAVMRRFQRKIYISMPDPATRQAVLSHMLKKCQPHSVSKTQLKGLVDMTEGYSCSDLTTIGGDAAFGPLRELGGMAQIAKAKLKNIRPVGFQDFETAIRNTKPSVSKSLLNKYKKWENYSGTT